MELSLTVCLQTGLITEYVWTKVNADINKTGSSEPVFVYVYLSFTAALQGGGRLRPLPAADEGSNKEWQRSKFCAAPRRTKFWVPQQAIPFGLLSVQLRLLISTQLNADFKS